MMRRSSFLSLTVSAFLLLAGLALGDDLATTTDLDLIEQTRDTVEAHKMFFA